MMWVVLAGVFGLAVGSFLNAVIARVPAGRSVVRPGSACPVCGAAIRARHNVPVLGWLVLRGSCADCAAPIPARYPMVELLTGLLFAATCWWAMATGRTDALPALLYLAAIGVVLTLIDIAHHRLPDRIVLPSYPVTATLVFAGAVLAGTWWPLLGAAIGTAAFYTAYFLLALVHPAGMGFGDVKLAGVLGMLLGYFGVAAAVVGFFAGFVLGAVVSLVLILLRRGTGKTALPFGPFMFVGTVVGVVAGEPVGAAYLGLVGL